MFKWLLVLLLLTSPAYAARVFVINANIDQTTTNTVDHLHCKGDSKWTIDGTWGAGTVKIQERVLKPNNTLSWEDVTDASWTTTDTLPVTKKISMGGPAELWAIITGANGTDEIDIYAVCAENQ